MWGGVIIGVGWALGPCRALALLIMRVSRVVSMLDCIGLMGGTEEGPWEGMVRGCHGRRLVVVGYYGREVHRKQIHGRYPEVG